MKYPLTCSLINRTWIESMKSDHVAFQQSLSNTKAVQVRYLKKLLTNNTHTEFGERFSFGGIKSIKDFQNNVPFSEYPDYESYIKSIAQGQNNILTYDKVSIFEPSSGSTSASKLIPYTLSLKKEFKKAIAPWLYSLYKNNPKLFRGKAYWSISPVMNKMTHKGKIKVGFDDDADYLGILGRCFYNRIAAVPSSVAQQSDLHVFRNITLGHLLLSQDLVLISIWNPTFLILLLDHLLMHKDQVLEVVQKICKQSNKINNIENILIESNDGTVFQKLWPNLTLISCWTDGASKPYTQQLRNYFPNIKIQGKGLIATEAFVSLPFGKDPDPVLAVNSHFYEFIEESTGQIYLAHELAPGKNYSVVVTTGGGLYRYQLEDIIEVTGFLDTAPTFRFVSKSNNISDVMGEKINEVHVNKCLEKLFSNLNLHPKFYLLAPVKKNGDISYCLFLECNGLTDDIIHEIPIQLDKMLCDNFHYDYCRKLEQLKNIVLFKIKCGGMNACLRHRINNGMKAGDVKHQCLSKDFGWDDHFEGFFNDRKKASL